MANYDYGWWASVLFNVVLFGGFVIGFIRPKKHIEWRTLGVFFGFIVALFTEMYGFPLTIYILTSVFQVQLPVADPFSHINGHLIGTILGLPMWGKLIICQVGGFLMLFGLILLGKGWKLIHAANGELVTSGIYAKIRHPQYLGMFIFSSGLLIQWTTLVGLLMFPVLMFAYYRLALREEHAVADQFGWAYYRYASRIPRFLPWGKIPEEPHEPAPLLLPAKAESVHGENRARFSGEAGSE
ncbi:MAG: isoprenylcysteine carboxylmethyltransferase family protein [Candidatus Marinimicrobia bacterium]|nr:isoprenylcysteine carboxylmethyltransferase family protein [Candidatus Neomarinimicrobiota bacterium]MCF7829773.1 isoprenylcysteine carboxylmethyltransferase family protein [Candidatus Neomarinimicrobiota bacterium]MCF7881723.1 isoprenylcysteine carboxylmethyltransferase family protein [Candidatus Neomarinimicrobiota bacterium]